MVFTGVKSGEFVTPNVLTSCTKAALPDFCRNVRWRSNAAIGIMNVGDFARRPALPAHVLQEYLKSLWLPAVPARKWLASRGWPRRG